MAKPKVVALPLLECTDVCMQVSMRGAGLATQTKSPNTLSAAGRARRSQPA